jgi:rhodanese-related sulfurtransferase
MLILPKARILIALFVISVGLDFLIFVSQDALRLHDLFTKQMPSPAIKPNSAYRFETLSLAETLQLFYTPGTVLIDVRSKENYEYGHIKDALNIPIEGIDKVFPASIQNLKPTSSVIVYCGGPNCGASFLAASTLADHGFDNIKVYPGGWPEWRSCRLPMTMSEKMQEDTKSKL